MGCSGTSLRSSKRVIIWDLSWESFFTKTNLNELECYRMALCNDVLVYEFILSWMYENLNIAAIA